MSQEASEQINYMRPRGRTKRHWFYLYYMIIILSFWCFLKTCFSAAALIRHLGGTSTETMGVQNPESCLDAWTVFATVTCSESLRSPQICSCGRWLLAHLRFLTSPPKLIPLDSEGLCWGTQSQSGAGSDPCWGQQRKGGRWRQLSMGWLVPRRSWDTSTSFGDSCRWQSPQVSHGRAMPWARDEPCCDIGVRHWFPTGLPFLIPVDFLVPCVRSTRCLW